MGAGPWFETHRFAMLLTMRPSEVHAIVSHDQIRQTTRSHRPGEILLEEFMQPNGLSQNRLARDIDVNPARINDIVHGRSAITASIALRLGKYFGTTPELWLNLQSDYELRRARARDWSRIERRVRILAAE
jgi:addiction module HigA family antidote